MKALHGQGFARDSCEENVEGIRGDRFLEETGGETCRCDEPVYFKEYIQPLQMAIRAVGLRGVDSKKDEFFFVGVLRM